MRAAYLPIFPRVALMLLGQLCDSFLASKVIAKDMGEFGRYMGPLY